MSIGGALDESIREIVRDVVREELRAALGVPTTDHRRNGDGYLSITKAAQLADVAAGTVRAWIRAGRLVARRAGRVYRISRAELEAFLERSAEERGDVDVRAQARRLAGGQY